MASIITNIYETTRRPCYVLDTKAMFLCWSQESKVIPPSMFKGGHSGGTNSGVMAIVEYEHGGVGKARPEDITFADGGGFSETAWLPLGRNQDAGEE